MTKVLTGELAVVCRTSRKESEKRNTEERADARRKNTEKDILERSGALRSDRIASTKKNMDRVIFGNLFSIYEADLKNIQEKRSSTTMLRIAKTIGLHDSPESHRYDDSIRPMLRPPRP